MIPHATTAEGRISRRAEYGALALVAVVAIALRLVRLGALSFSGDEETTTLGALALLRGWPPTLPGGAIYIRELPFTFPEAAVLAVCGLNEFALRLLPALFVGPRVVAQWWLARPFLGPTGSLVAAAILAVVPLDFELSRIARMYSLFAAFDLVFVAAVVHTALGRRRSALAAGSGVLSVSTHLLGVTHAPVALGAALGRDVPWRRKWVLGSVGMLVLVSYLVMSKLTEWGYAAAGPPTASTTLHQGLLTERLASTRELISTPSRVATVALMTLVVLGLASFGFRGLRTLSGRIAGILAAIACAIGAAVVGGVLLLSVPIFERGGVIELWRRGKVLLAAAAVSTAAWFLLCTTAGVGFGGALRFLLGFPYPNWYDLVQAAPLLSLLSFVGVLVAVDRAGQGEQQGAWIALIAAALGPPLVTGLVARDDSLRYEIHAIAPMIVLSLLASILIARRVVRSGVGVIAGAAILTLVAVRPDYTLRAMFRDYGPVSEPFAVLNVAPDHRGAADFVRAQSSAEDWIVAEDMLQQYLYLGRVDVWLRRREDAAQFLRGGSKDGVPRDEYTGAMHAHDLQALWDLSRAKGRRVMWLITSGEVEASPRYYRTSDTDATLLEWRPLAWYLGLDGMTRVYRVVDGRPIPPPASIAKDVH